MAKKISMSKSFGHIQKVNNKATKSGNEIHKSDTSKIVNPTVGKYNTHK